MNKGRVTSISSGNLSLTGTNFCNKKILVIAKRGSGKSWLCEAIIKDVLKRFDSDFVSNQSKFVKSQIEKMIIVSPTERMNKFYENKFNCDIRYELGNLNDIAINELQNKKSMMILDDCLSTGKKSNYEALEYMLAEMDNLTLIVTIAYPLLDKELFSLFDYVLFGNEDFIPNRKRFYERVPTGIKTFDEFNKIMNNQPNYHFLMVDVKKKIVGLNGTNGLLIDDIINNSSRTKYDIDKLTISVKNVIDMEYALGESTLIINSDEMDNSKIVNNLIFKYEQSYEEIIVIHEFGRNNYTSNIAKVHRPDDDGVLKHVLDEKKHKSNKMLILEYSSSKLLKKDKSRFYEVMMNGRHYNITIVVVEKVPPIIPPEIRLNIDRVIVGKYIEKPIMQKIYDNYFGILPERSILYALMDYVDDCNYIMVNNRKRSTVITDKLHFFVRTEFMPVKKYSGEITKDDNECKIEYYNADDIDFQSVVRYLKYIDSKLDRLDRKISNLENFN